MSAIPRPAHFYQFTNIDQTFLRLYATITRQPLSHNLLKNLRNNSSNELQKQALFLSNEKIKGSQLKPVKIFSKAESSWTIIILKKLNISSHNF